jgi:hypothetical protein
LPSAISGNRSCVAADRISATSLTDGMPNSIEAPAPTTASSFFFLRQSPANAAHEYVIMSCINCSFDASNRNPLIQRDLIPGAVVELGGARAFMGRHRLRVFLRTAGTLSSPRRPASRFRVSPPSRCPTRRSAGASISARAAATSSPRRRGISVADRMRGRSTTIPPRRNLRAAGLADRKARGPNNQQQQ